MRIASHTLCALYQTVPTRANKFEHAVLIERRIYLLKTSVCPSKELTLIRRHSFKKSNFLNTNANTKTTTVLICDSVYLDHHETWKCHFNMTAAYVILHVVYNQVKWILRIILRTTTSILNQWTNRTIMYKNHPQPRLQLQSSNKFLNHSLYTQ